MRKSIWVIFVIFIWLCSCDKSEELSLLNVDFGKAEYYKPFLFKKMDSVILEREFEVNFNENALNEQLRLSFLDENLKKFSSEYVTFYYNGKVCENGLAIIDGSDNVDRIKIGISFSKVYPNEGRHSGFVVVENPDSFDEVSSFSQLELINDPAILQWEAEYDLVINPLLKLILAILIGILVFVLLWFLVLRNHKYPKFKLGKLQIVSPYNKSLTIKGYREVVFSNETQRQGLFDAFWRGRIRYEVNSFWTEEVTITPKRKNRIKIKIPQTFVSSTPYNNVSRNTEIKFKTENREDVKIKYS